MTIAPRIILNNVSFHLKETSVFFERVNLSFEARKYGVVGANGIGKSTFLKLLLGSLTPDTGSIAVSGRILDLPQLHCTEHQGRISEVLGIQDILDASARIQSGDVEEKDFELMAENWDIDKRIEDAFVFFNLWPIDLNRAFTSLSGGQKTKVLLAKTCIFPNNFLILDEPTNNLDAQSRAILYEYIENIFKGVIIVSHDRKLLNKCGRIIELTSKGIDVYGGNYDFYKEQKEIKRRALKQEIQSKLDALVKSKQSIQREHVIHEKKQSKGRNDRKNTSQSKLIMDRIKSRSEKTQSRNATQSNKKLEVVNQALSAARNQLEIQEKLDFLLAQTKVPNNKMVINLENICFGYDKQSNLINNFNLHLSGPERVAITGPNGCGKSTLIQLIRGLLLPSTGEIMIGVKTVAYLDQTMSFLDPSLSVLDNFLTLNPDAQHFDAYSALGPFKFRNKEAKKYVGQLSGGERMRAGFAISLMSSTPPQLIILDEPTNHLDLDAIEAIEEALIQYQGAILVISHDEAFLENIKIDRSISFT